MKTRYAVLALAAAALFFAACATPPTEEMDNAYNAVTQAENDADAVAYAGNTLILARDALTRMQAEADAKRYEAAVNFAAEAVRLSEKAIADGKTGAARAREEAEALVAGLEEPLAETSASLDTARGAGDIEADFETLGADLETARETYGEARQSLGDSDYAGTAEKCQNVRSTLDSINTALTGAAQATSRKR